jgi:multimeric flavodoxin WrbA
MLGVKKMIVIISDDEKQNVGLRIYKELSSKNIEVSYICASEADVKPCYSCDGCTDKTFGKCVVRDDGDKIYPKLLRADVWVFITPLMWGTYSFKTKRVIDKLAVIGNRYYYVKDKELVKGVQGNVKKIYAIGVKDYCSTKEENVFFGLVAENFNIMGITGNSFIVSHNVGDYDLSNIAKEVAGE